MLIEMIKTADRTDEIKSLMENKSIIISEIYHKLSLSDIDKAIIDSRTFYSLAVQAGYLTLGMQGIDTYVYIPNREIWEIWHSKILSGINDYSSATSSTLGNILKNINNTEQFDRNLMEHLNYKLSCYDFRYDYERVYHAFVLGMIDNSGFKCTSNRESGNGRYDILIESNDFNVIVEFKSGKCLNDLEALALNTLNQIDNKKYYEGSDKSKELYKVGIACYMRETVVKTIKHSLP